MHLVTQPLRILIFMLFLLPRLPLSSGALRKGLALFGSRRLLCYYTVSCIGLMRPTLWVVQRWCVLIRFSKLYSDVISGFIISGPGSVFIAALSVQKHVEIRRLPQSEGEGLGLNVLGKPRAASVLKKRPIADDALSMDV